MTEDSNRSYRRRYDSLDPGKDKTSERSMSSYKHISKSPCLSVATEVGGKGVKLAQEIQDELLICKICLGNYKQPKSLQCLHTFCAQCIENHIRGEVTYKKYSDYREFTCPLCRHHTSLPLGGVRKLPDNFLITSLCAMVNKQIPSEADEDDSNSGVSTHLCCQICQKTPTRKRESYSKCLDCNKMLCKTCTDLHKTTKVTQNHAMFDIKIEDDVICKAHPEESIRFFCEPCESCICILCTFNEHKDHDVVEFTEAVSKYKSSIEEKKVNCLTIIEEFEKKLEKIKSTEAIIKDTEEVIGNLATKLIDEIRNREKQLLEEINNMYGVDMLNIIGSKSKLETKLAELRSACSMSELVLQRKGVELLLLKKDIQEKLSETDKLPHDPLPKTSEKIIRFVPGILEFGCIQDMDRPMLTKPKPIKMSFENGSYDTDASETTQDISTQTDDQYTTAPSLSTNSKLIGTDTIEVRNIAINTVARVVFHSQKPSNSQHPLANTTTNIEVKPITCAEKPNTSLNAAINPENRRLSCAVYGSQDTEIANMNNRPASVASTENLATIIDEKPDFFDA